MTETEWNARKINNKYRCRGILLQLARDALTNMKTSPDCIAVCGVSRCSIIKGKHNIRAYKSDC